MDWKRKYNSNYFDMDSNTRKKVRDDTIQKYLSQVDEIDRSDVLIEVVPPENNNYSLNDVNDDANANLNALEMQESIELPADFVPELDQYMISPEPINNDQGELSDSDSEGEEEIDKGALLASKIRQLVIDGQINVTVANKILKDIRDCDLGVEIPKCYNDLMDIPTKTKQPSKINGGEYIHMGIQENFLRLDSEILNDTTEIVLDISFDGVPGFNSSNQQLWVISGGIVNRRVDPIIIGIFVGDTKPHNPAEFFYLTLEEVDRLRIDGILVGHDRVSKSFRTRAMIGDTPARCWATGALGHTGKSSCPVCNQVAVRIGNYTVFSPHIGRLRTNESFRNRVDPEYNK